MISRCCWGSSSSSGARAAPPLLLLPAWSRRALSSAADGAPDGSSAVAASSSAPEQDACDAPQQEHQQQRRQRQGPALPDPAQQRSLVVAVVGLPNAGKSTLVNRLIGAHISGVSSKRNTTITPQLGNFTVGDSQVLLYDTPGLVDESAQGSPLERLRSAWSTAATADQLLFIVDAERQFRYREPVLLKLAQQLAVGPPALLLPQHWRAPPVALFLNKQDKLEPAVRATVLAGLRRQLADAGLSADRVFEGAAMLGQGVPQLKAYLADKALPGPWLMTRGRCHAATPGELAVELVREKLYRRLNQEIPYQLGVSLRASWRAGGRLNISVLVTTKNSLQRSIVVGKGGGIIHGYVQAPTEAQLSRTLGEPVKLYVIVKALQD